MYGGWKIMNGLSMIGSFLIALGFPLGAKGISSNSLVLKILSGLLIILGIVSMGIDILDKEEWLENVTHRITE